MEIVDMNRKKVKIPRRTVHFANGDTMEEYSTDEEEEEEEHLKKRVVTVDPVRRDETETFLLWICLYHLESVL